MRKRPSEKVVKDKTIGLSGRRVEFNFAEKNEQTNQTPDFNFNEEEGEENEEVRFINPTTNSIKTNLT